jgi:hypothetical protein
VNSPSVERVANRPSEAHQPAAAVAEGEGTAAEVFAAQAIFWPFATLVLTALLFWEGVPISPFHAWLGLALALGAAWFLSADTRSWALATAGLAVVTLVGGIALDWLYDFSGDGQWYHLPAIIALAEGWNPFRTPELAAWNAELAKEVGTGAIYVQHYAKGAWIVAAAAYKATGAIEGAKVFNLLLLLASWLVALRFLRRAGLSRGWSHGLALAVALNPVILYQLPSFFVDGQLAALCTLLLVLSLDYLREPRRATLALLVACTVLLANTKFTGVVYAAALGAGLTALAALRRVPHARTYALAGLLALAGAIVVAGYQPYVTNLERHANPFYPAVGRDEAATAATRRQFEIWAPAEFMAMGRIEKLGRSLLAASAGAESMPRIKVPFTISKQELYIFFNTEPRYGGFGPLFGSALVASLLVFALARRNALRPAWTAAAALSLVVSGSALLNPEAWWARLSPQIWLVPPMLVAATAFGASTWLQRFGAALLTVLVANSVLVAGLNWGRAVEKNLTFRSDLARLRAMAARGPLELALHPSFRVVAERRLKAAGIEYHLVATPSCKTPLRFSSPASAQGAACLAAPRKTGSAAGSMQSLAKELHG